MPDEPYLHAIIALAMDDMTLLSRGAEELGLRLEPHQLHQYQRYYHELDSWNQRINLTSVTDYEGVQIVHLLDSLTAAPLISSELRSSGRLLDIGSGAGFPGIPLKIAFPKLRLALMDSIGKKTAFLSHLCSALDIPEVDILTGRAETLAHDPELREAFDIVVTRGVSSMRVLMELTLPFCRPGGIVITWKKGQLEEEINASLYTMELMGGRLGEVREVNLDGLRDGRVLIIVNKVHKCPERFPRRAGLPQKRPIAAGQNVH